MYLQNQRLCGQLQSLVFFDRFPGRSDPYVADLRLVREVLPEGGS